MAIKRLTTRIVNKHATAAIWNSATTFIPMQGELIIYDPGYDSVDGKTYTRERVKVGDGKHTINELPFVNELDVKTNKNVQTTKVVTSVEAPVYTSANYTAPVMGQELSEDVLTITFDAGNYVPAQFVSGKTTETTLTYIEDVNVTAETPQ